MIFPLLNGCQQQPSKDCEKEIGMVISKMSADGNLLTEEEARLALFNMITKEEARREGLYKLWDEENEAEWKIWAEYRKKAKELLEMTVKEEAIRERCIKLLDEENRVDPRIWAEDRKKVMELLETTEDHEVMKQALEEFRMKRNEQLRNASSHYTTLIDNYQKETREREERERLEIIEDTENEKLFNGDYDKLFEDCVVITMTEVKNLFYRGNGNVECDLKTGWFRESGVTVYYFDSDDFGRLFNAVHGRFRKNKNGEWVATFVTYPIHGDYAGGD